MNSHLLSGSPRPLEPDQRHCPYCDGYGYRPRRQDEPSGPKAIRCSYCDGTALRDRRM
jgi:hypothetical protein